MKPRPVLALVLSAIAAMTSAAAAPAAPLPARLSETGLYLHRARPRRCRRRRRVLAAVPAVVRRHAQAALDRAAARHGDRRRARRRVGVPVGTRLWKEFGYGQPHRDPDDRAACRTARGASPPMCGMPRAPRRCSRPKTAASVPVADAPGGRYAVPCRNDCTRVPRGRRRCRCSASVRCSCRPIEILWRRTPIRARWPDGPAQPRRARLAARPAAELLETPPRIEAASATARAALGYLHGNCGHCHNAAGALTGLELVLAQQAEANARSAERTLAVAARRIRAASVRNGTASAQRIASGRRHSVLTLRMKSDNPLARMPPLGVQVVDPKASP